VEASATFAGLPAVADGVELLGRLAGSGYKETPTLVRRSDDQMVKLTPLLYELLGAMNGRRTYEELAEELSARVGKLATAGDVRFLIERKLEPLGLVETPGRAPRELAKANPLLVLRPRFVITKPELTRLLTQPFVWLFRLPVASALMMAFAAISVWLLADKGLSSALHQAMYQPGMILAIWGLVVLSAAFHEIGHAAACRYGGAKPGVMGGGLYLIWPAFYTEVSDAYRLSRAGRLRVDLGGLYFTAIFAVASAALWLATGADALLLVIAVQLIQMAKQLTPFIRADGYHILADLTGVPDLFSHIKPTLLGLLPERWTGPQHQALRPWARAVVTAWVLITVPVLLGVLALMVLTLPRIAATGWDSIVEHWGVASATWGEGDRFGAAVSAVSTGLVAIPVLSVLYLLARLAQRAGRSTWRRTAGRPRLRALYLVGVAALVGAVAWAWWPDASYRPISTEERGPVPTVLQPPVGDASLSAMPVGHRPQARQPRRVLVRPRAASEGIAAVPLRRRAALALSETVARRIGTVQEVGGVTESAAVPAAGPPPAPLGNLPGPSAEPLSTWPFPFDPPEPTQPGDNRAMAVNTEDGTRKWDFKPAFVTVEDGAPVRHTNDAHAYASCRDCVTGATAFQVILVVGNSDEIAPVNAAAAANYHCVNCHTYAFAYQIVASVTEVTPEVQQALDAAHERLRGLEAQASSLTGAEIHNALEEVEHSILESLDEVIAVETDTDSAVPQEGDAMPPPDPPPEPQP
jgi:putative peptide zinc metalloprotease protein